MSTEVPLFESFPSIARLSRSFTVTEKIDGTNAQVCVLEDGRVLAGSRSRWITPDADNFGFAAWVKAHEDELRTGLGVGSHFGRLRMIWGEFSLGVVAMKLGRTKHSVFNRACDLKLPLGVPDGCEYLTDAAVRCGVWVETLRRILEWAGVRIRRTMSRPTKKHVKRPQHFVDSFEADEAVAAWTRSEAVTAAAKARRIDPRRLVRSLALINGVPPKPPGKHHWRVPSELIDQAIGRAA